MTTILALDLSSKSTGHAVFRNDELVLDSLGTIKLDHETHGERLTIFEDKIIALLQKYNPDSVVIEEIWKGPNIKTFKILSYYHGVAQLILFRWKKLLPTMIMPSEARRILSVKYDVKLVPKKPKTKGKKRKKPLKDSKDSKELTFDFIKKKFNFSTFVFKIDNDITDAVALGLAYLIYNEGINGSV